MYLSRLNLNLTNRDVLRDLRDCQDMHRTLVRAFPAVNGCGGDGVGPRARYGILHRVDVDGSRGRVTLMVQSRERPDWGALPPGYVLLEENQPAASLVKEVDESYAALVEGQRLAFRLRANPTRKLKRQEAAQGSNNGGPEGGEERRRTQGKRVEIKGFDNQLAWLRRKAEAGGFRLDTVNVGDWDELPEGAPAFATPERKVQGRRNTRSKPDKLTFASVLFEGELVITDAERFRRVLADGIGSAKAYGFGLLSVAPARG